MPHKNYVFKQKTLQASLVTKGFGSQFIYKFPEIISQKEKSNWKQA